MLQWLEDALIISPGVHSVALDFLQSIQQVLGILLEVFRGRPVMISLGIAMKTLGLGLVLGDKGVVGCTICCWG